MPSRSDARSPRDGDHLGAEQSSAGNPLSGRRHLVRARRRDRRRQRCEAHQRGQAERGRPVAVAVEEDALALIMVGGGTLPRRSRARESNNNQLGLDPIGPPRRPPGDGDLPSRSLSRPASSAWLPGCSTRRCRGVSPARSRGASRWSPCRPVLAGTCFKCHGGEKPPVDCGWIRGIALGGRR